MENTLVPDQYVLVDKMTPHWDTYSAAISSCSNPRPTWAQADDTPFIKRVIGLRGDTWT